MTKKKLKETALIDYDHEELHNILTCIRWLIQQLEEMHYESIAVVFQKAVEDTESWIHTMLESGLTLTEKNEKLFLNEALIIRKLLVRYSSIQDPEIRKSILENMARLTQKSKH